MVINGVAKMDALEIAEEIVAAVEKAGPAGLSFVAGSSLVDMEYNQFYQAAHALSRLGYVKIGRGANGHRNRIIKPDAVEPVELAVSAGQRKVLEYLHANADENGLVRASLKQIGEATGMTCPSFCLQRLGIKGYLDYADLGGPSRPAIYKVFPDGTGQKSDTWWLVKYGRLPAVEWAIERGYSLGTYANPGDEACRT